MDLVELTKDYRLEEKYLVEAFRLIDKEGEGTVNFNKIKRISIEKQLNFTDEEIKDMLNYFEIEDNLKNLLLYGIKSNDDIDEKNIFDYNKFCELYYEGNS